MTVYKLTVNLDATLAVQNPNGSFHYFKPSVGAEFTTDDTDNLTVLKKQFEDLYTEVIGPNFSAVVKEFLINSEDKSEEELDTEGKCQCETSDSCSCKPLEIGVKPETVNNDENLSREEWE